MSVKCYPLTPGSPSMCYGYSSFRYKHKIYVYGGCWEDNVQEVFLEADLIYELNLFTKTWTQHEIKHNGALPNARVYSLMVPLQDQAYMFCGFDSGLFRTCDLRSLDLNNYEFNLLENPPISKRDKLEAWTYGDSIYFFGGYGPVSMLPIGEKSLYSTDRDPAYSLYGWNNELVAYDTALKSWSSPSLKGEAPCGRAAYGLVQFGHRVYFVCGRRVERRCSEVHMLDMREEEWSGEIKPSGKCPVPEGRSWLACCQAGDHNIFIHGGINQGSKALSDMWLFDINTCIWSELITEHPLTPRIACRGHPGLEGSSVIVISGRKMDMFQLMDVPYKNIINDDCLVLEFDALSLTLICLKRLHQLLKNGKIELCRVRKTLPPNLYANYLELIS